MFDMAMDDFAPDDGTEALKQQLARTLAGNQPFTPSSLQTQLRAPLPGQEGAMPQSTAAALRAGTLPPIINPPPETAIGMRMPQSQMTMGDRLSNAWSVLRGPR